MKLMPHTLRVDFSTPINTFMKKPFTVMATGRPNPHSSGSQYIVFGQQSKQNIARTELFPALNPVSLLNTISVIVFWVK